MAAGVHSRGPTWKTCQTSHLEVLTGRHQVSQARFKKSHTQTADGSRGEGRGVRGRQHPLDPRQVAVGRWHR